LFQHGLRPQRVETGKPILIAPLPEMLEHLTSLIGVRWSLTYSNSGISVLQDILGMTRFLALALQFIASLPESAEGRRRFERAIAGQTGGVATPAIFLKQSLADLDLIAIRHRLRRDRSEERRPNHRRHARLPHTRTRPWPAFVMFSSVGS
jgi:hypothetical protein